jgi:hypothetical protein
VVGDQPIKESTDPGSCLVGQQTVDWAEARLPRSQQEHLARLAAKLALATADRHRIHPLAVIEKDAIIHEAMHSAALDAAFTQELDGRADAHVVQRRGGCKAVQPLVQLLGIVRSPDRGTRGSGYVPEPPFQQAEQRLLQRFPCPFFL